MAVLPLPSIQLRQSFFSFKQNKIKIASSSLQSVHILVQAKERAQIHHDQVRWHIAPRHHQLWLGRHSLSFNFGLWQRRLSIVGGTRVTHDGEALGDEVDKHVIVPRGGERAVTVTRSSPNAVKARGLVHVSSKV